MSKVIRLKKGLDINLIGEAEKVITVAPVAETYAVKPTDFMGVTPKLLVKVDDEVKAGTPLFFDKYNPEVLVAAPISGTIVAINRGAKRKILEIVIAPSAERSYEEFKIGDLASLSREDVVAKILEAGLWSFMTQRPYGIIASSKDTPRDIFVSGFDSAPLAGDVDFMIKECEAEFKTGMEVLKKLTSGKVYLGVSEKSTTAAFKSLTGVEVNTFSGKHPVGNVGIQIHHTAPISKGDTVWTVNIQDLVILGRLFATGKVDMTRIIAVAGSMIEKPHYCKVISGATLKSVIADSLVKSAETTPRIICGNVLTGEKVAADSYVAYQANAITAIPEGDYYEFLGWIAPRLNKFSVSRSYLSWMCPSKKYNLDTNVNGGERAFVMTGEYEKVLPMDIYPVYLLKAILAGDIDKMENLGIYEVIEEDLALCEFVCTSKIDVQQIVRDGINLMIKELS
ncbi:MAG: Na(+)-translocating NADH-quinone reductase subunit A [Rikenellaceae bacterium]